MPVYRNSGTGKWYVSVSYKDAENKRHYTTKRGFQTKQEALYWEIEFKSRKSRSMNKKFGEF